MKSLTQYINESVGGVKIAPMINVVAWALGFFDFSNFKGFVSEVESQDYISWNDDFDDENEFCSFVLAHKDDVCKWEYSFNFDGYYDIWTTIGDKTINLMVWDDGIASELDEKFDGEYEAGDDKYDKAFFKSAAKEYAKIPNLKV